MKLLLSLVYLYCVTATVFVPHLNLTIQSGQLTPYGTDHPLFDPVEAEYIFVEQIQTPGNYTGKIVFTYNSGNGLADDIILYYKNIGAVGIIIIGYASQNPGDSISRMRNEHTFVDTIDDVNFIFPAVGITSDDSKILIDYYNNFTLDTSQYPRVVISATLDDNVWKHFNDLICIILMKIIGITINTFVIIWIIYIFVLIFTKLNVRDCITPLVCLLFLCIGSCISIPGLLNHNGSSQLYTFAAAIFFSYMGDVFVCLAFLLQAILMISAVKYTGAKINLFLTNTKWPYIIACVIYFGFNLAISLIYGSNTLSPDITNSLTIVWSIINILCLVVFSILYIVGSFMIISKLKRMSDIHSRPKNFLNKTMTIYVLISFLLILICIITPFTAIYYSDPVIYSILVLCVVVIRRAITFLITLCVYLNIRKQWMCAHSSQNMTKTKSTSTS